MTYDKYKLSNPQYDGWTSDEVTSCCGDECEQIEDENCELQIVCIACGYYCDMIEPHEYEERQREKYAEMKEDY